MLVSIMKGYILGWIWGLMQQFYFCFFYCFTGLCNGQLFNKIMLPCKINIQSPYPKIPVPTLISLPKPDVYISINTHIFPGHRKKLSYIPSICCLKQSQRIYLITEQLHIGSLQQIIKYGYGNNITINSMQQFKKIQQIIQFLNIQQIQQQIENTLISIIPQSDIFIILNFAYKTNLPNIIQACLKYLQEQQFEPFKIYQYSLLQTQFKLFQIIVRRHHRLKINKKISGIPIEIIQQLLEIYCRRQRFDHQIYHCLYMNYVDPWYIRKQLSRSNSNNNINIINKQSLRLHKLSYKNIGQSTTIHENDSLKRSKQQQIFSNSPSCYQSTSYGKMNIIISNVNHKHQNLRVRKYSMEIEKALGQMGFKNNDIKSNILEDLHASVQHVIPEQDQIYLQDILIQTEPGLNNQKYSIQLEKQTRKNQVQRFLQDVSYIGQGNLKLKIHQIDYQEKKDKKYKIKSKSMIFNQVIQEEMEESIDYRFRKFSKIMPRSNSNCPQKV